MTAETGTPIVPKQPSGAPHRLAALLAILALSLSAITLVRAMGGQPAPVLPPDIQEREAQIQDALDKADAAPIPAGVAVPATDRRPSRPE